MSLKALWRAFWGFPSFLQVASQLWLLLAFAADSIAVAAQGLIADRIGANMIEAAREVAGRVRCKVASKFESAIRTEKIEAWARMRFVLLFASVFFSFASVNIFWSVSAPRLVFVAPMES